MDNKPVKTTVDLGDLRPMLLFPPRNHSPDTILKSDLWFVAEDPPSFFDVMPPHTTAVRNPIPRKHVGFPPQPTPKLRKRGKDVTERLWEHYPSLFQPFFFALGIDDLVKLAPDISREVPEVSGLSICNEKNLSGNLQRGGLRSGKGRFRKGVELCTDNGTRLILERRVVEVLSGASAFRRLLECGALRSCFRRGDTTATRREPNRREVPVEHVRFFSGQ